jgi:hypothetical protein
MSSSTYKHEAAWCCRLPDGWPILSLDLTPKGACLCLSTCWRDRAGVSFVTTGEPPQPHTQRERRVHLAGGWFSALLHRLPPFRKERGKMGHPSFVFNLGMQPCARE